MFAVSKRRLIDCSVMLSTLLGASTLANNAHAEGLLTDGEVGIGTGLEGGDAGKGKIEWQRARTRISAGVEIRSDEDADQGVAFRAFAEIEKRGSVGGEARYVRWASPTFGLYAGLIGTLAPETLFGGGIGARFLIGKKAGIWIEPSFNALPLGSDLPGDTILLWALVNGGVRFGL
jgi:hypothetical protein